MHGVFLFLRQESSNLKSCCYRMCCILCGPLKHVSNLHEFSLSRFWPLWLEERMENWVSQASSFLFSFSSIFSPLPFIFLPNILFAHILNPASSLVISASLLFWFCPIMYATLEWHKPPHREIWFCKKQLFEFIYVMCNKYLLFPSLMPSWLSTRSSHFSF